jgi:hypothetical protein
LLKQKEPLKRESRLSGSTSVIQQVIAYFRRRAAKPDANAIAMPVNANVEGSGTINVATKFIVREGCIVAFVKD